MKQKVKYATWTVVKDPLRYLDCPHCGKIIIIHKINVIEKLLKWAKERNETK